MVRSFAFFLFHFYGTWHSRFFDRNKTRKRNNNGEQEREKTLTTVNYKQIEKKKKVNSTFSFF